MILRRLAIAFLCLTSCNTVGSPRPVSYDESTVPQTVNPISDRPGVRGSPEIDAISSAPGTAGTEPTTERVVGYVAIIAGVMACTILIIGFYKLAKLLGH